MSLNDGMNSLEQALSMLRAKSSGTSSKELTLSSRNCHHTAASSHLFHMCIPSDMALG